MNRQDCVKMGRHFGRVLNRKDGMRHKVCCVWFVVIVLSYELLAKQVMKAFCYSGAFITGNLSVDDSGTTVEILEVVERQGQGIKFVLRRNSAEVVIE